MFQDTKFLTLHGEDKEPEAALRPIVSINLETSGYKLVMDDEKIAYIITKEK